MCTHWLRPLVVFAVLATLPLQWISFFEVLGRSVKPPHLALGGVALAFALLPRRFARLGGFIRETRWFCVAVAAFLAVRILAIAWSPDLALGVSMLVKMVVYFIAFLLFGTLVLHTDDRATTRAAYVGAFAGIATFVVIASVVFAALGRNFVLEYLTAMLSGDVAALQFGFYTTIFNFRGGQYIAQGEAGFLGTSLRHTLVGAFVLYALLFQVYTPIRMRRAWRRAGRVGLVVASLLVFLSVSRQQILTLGAAWMLAGVVRFVRARGRLRRRTAMLTAFGGAVAVVLAATIFADVVAGAADILEQRAVTVTRDSRLDIAAVAIREINDHVLLGKGLGTTVEYGYWFPQRPHHLILGTWLDAGLLGLIVAIGFLASIIAYMVRAYQTSWRLHTSLPWTLTLPLLLLVESQVGGDGGEPTLMQWLAMSFFFALLAKNRIATTGHQRPRASMIRCTPPRTTPPWPGS